MEDVAFSAVTYLPTTGPIGLNLKRKS